MARLLKGPEGEPMSDEDILLALRIYATKEYGGPRKYDFMQIADTIAQVESGNNPFAKQIGGGPGRGKYQYEEPSAITAGNRLRDIASIVGYENPSWNTPENIKDVSKLTSEQQDILFLADKLAAGDVDLGSLASGETSGREFWIKSHGRFPPEDIPARTAHWEETVSAMKELPPGELVEEKKHGGKIRLKKKNKMRLLRADKGFKFRKKGDDVASGMIDPAIFASDPYSKSSISRSAVDKMYHSGLFSGYVPELESRLTFNPSTERYTRTQIESSPAELKHGGRFKLLEKILFSGGSIPYEDYGMDDSGMMSYQNAGDQFMSENTLVGGLPQDAIQAQDPQFHIPVYKSKQDLRKEKRDAMKQSRKDKKAFRKQLRDEREAAGMSKRGGTYYQQTKDYRKGEFKEGKEAAKAIKHWKD